jgi:hypothetical protein
MNDRSTHLRRFAVLTASLLIMLPCVGALLPWDATGLLAKLWPTYFVPWDKAATGYPGAVFPKWPHLQILFLFLPLLVCPFTVVVLSIYSFRTRGVILSVDIHIAAVLAGTALFALAFCPAQWLGKLLWQAHPYVLGAFLISAIGTVCQGTFGHFRSALVVAAPMTILNTFCSCASLAVMPWIAGGT